MDLGLTDRVYVVTGGARGLGRATLDVLVAEGARAVVSGRSQESLDEVASVHGDAVVTVVADNADADTPARLVAAAREGWQRLDGALISVGGPPPGPVTTVTDEQWRNAFESVFLGGVRLARDIGAELGEGGSLAMVLSSSVNEPVPNLAVSNGLRPGLAGVAKTLADEVGPRGIRVNALLPGRLGTERVAELDASTGDAEAARAAAVAKIPLGRYGEPEEVAALINFLLSDEASYITSSLYTIDGGMSVF